MAFSVSKCVPLSMALLFFFLLAIVSSVLTFEPEANIKCYNCTSAENPKCAEKDPGENLLVDCNTWYNSWTSSQLERSWRAKNLTAPRSRGNMNPKQKFFCRRNVFEIDERVTTVLSCGWEEHPKDKDCYYTSNPTAKSAVCQCVTSKCNPASRVGANALLGLFGSLLAVLGCHLRI